MHDLSMNENSDELKITELGFQLLVPMVKDNALACAEITARDITFLQEQVSSSVHVLAHGSTLLLQTVLTSSIAVHSRLTTQHLQHFFGQVSARGDVRHAAWNVRHATCSMQRGIFSIDFSGPRRRAARRSGAQPRWAWAELQVARSIGQRLAAL
jgi:hypothetical protein